MNRREFTRNAAFAAAAIPLASMVPIDKKEPEGIRKGIMWGSIGYGKTVLEKFRAAKEAGFDGVEVMSHMDRNEVLAASQDTGLPICSVCGNDHWRKPLSDPDPSVRDEGLAALKHTLEDAAAYKTDTILLVPGRVSDKVYYDDCWKRSVDQIKLALPLAEKLKVKIAIENVWNNFLLSPVEAVTYIDQFKSKYVGWYFDCGNILNTGWPEQWIRILGKRIARVHIKEFSKKLADEKGKSAGFGVKLLEGDVNWQAVMKALKEIEYTAWTTIEQPGGDNPEGLKDLCDRLIKIQAS
ncbi:MAG: sugar phosphate isomerase/epimerase family protein [Bacteroidales bacterium]